MFYLVTGGVGTAKTCFTLRWVRDLQLKTGRPVCYTRDGNGETLLRLKGEALEFGWKEVNFEDWQAQDDGTIFLVDECHEVMPTRGMGSKPVPAHIQALARHRHRGFDFFLITQHPSNIDSFVRRLIADPGWHRHLKRRGGAEVSAVLEWPSVNEKCEKLAAGKTATVSHKMFPKEVYDWYESASIHTAKLRIPKQLWIIVAALVAVPVLIYAVIAYLRGFGGEEGSSASPVASIPSVSTAAASLSSGIKREEGRSLTASEYVETLMPRMPGLLYTAPRYDEITAPKRAPFPAACVMKVADSDCKCFTQDATPYQISSEMCRRIAKEGLFIDWQEPPLPVSQAAPAAAQPVVYPGINESAPVQPRPAAQPALKEQGLIQQELDQQEEVNRHLRALAVQGAARRAAAAAK